MFSSNAELYSALKNISKYFRDSGDTSIAQKIDDAMYSGCTSGEVLDDILGTLIDLRKHDVFINTKYVEIVDGMIEDIKKALDK